MVHLLYPFGVILSSISFDCLWQKKARIAHLLRGTCVLSSISEGEGVKGYRQQITVGSFAFFCRRQSIGSFAEGDSKATTIGLPKVIDKITPSLEAITPLVYRGKKAILCFLLPKAIHRFFHRRRPFAFFYQRQPIGSFTEGDPLRTSSGYFDAYPVPRRGRGYRRLPTVLSPKAILCFRQRKSKIRSPRTPSPLATHLRCTGV